MDLIAQLVSLPGGSNIMGILFFSGLILLFVVSFGGWGNRELSKNWKIIWTIVGIIFILFALLVFYIIIKNPQIATEQVAPSEADYTVPESDNKSVSILETVSKAMITIIVACLPVGLALILLSILTAKKFTEKQQKDLLKFGIILAVGSFFLILSMFSNTGAK